MIEKIKKYIKTHKKDVITFILTNRLFLFFVLIALFETQLIKVMTLGSTSLSLKTLFFDFAVALLFGAFGYLFKVEKQYKYFEILIVLLSIICTVNLIYYAFFNSFVTVGLLETLGQVESVSDAVWDKLRIYHAIFLVFPFIYAYINKRLKGHNYYHYVKKIEISKKNFSTILLLGVICLCMNIITLTKTDYSRLIKQWNREYIVQRYGIVIYHVNDIIQNTQSKLSAYFGYDEAAQKFHDYYDNREIQVSNNRYTGVFKDKNLVLVHMESIMDMFIDMKVNDEEVTPNLNKLVRQGLYFKNFYTEVSTGTSSDTEFTLNNSLMPVASGTVFVSYYDRTYETIEKMLKEKGYYTFSMHANTASMWNREAMYNSIGYDDFYSKTSFNVTEDTTIGLGLSDHEFFKQAIPILEKIEKDHDKYSGTIITLTNHTPWEGGDLYGEFPLTKTVTRINEKTGEEETVEDKYLEDTKIGDYIRSVHYADKCLGEFVDYLYENDMFDDTVIVFYGDHDAKLASKEYNYLFNYSPELGRLKTEEDEGYVNYDYYANELNRKTPLLIWTKDHKYVKEIDYYMGMIDVLPTLGNMFGFSSKYALGHDIFEIKNDNIIPFPNGNFVTERVYYNNSKGEYKVLQDSAVIDEKYIETSKDYTEKVLDLSNDIIVYNLIETEGENANNE